VEANITGGQGSRRAVAPSDDDEYFHLLSGLHLRTRLINFIVRTAQQTLFSSVMKPISAIRGKTVVSSENLTQHRHAACRQDVKCTSNITLRCVHETTVAVGKCYILLLLFVCVCVSM
jgi:hypothetical protein